MIDFVVVLVEEHVDLDGSQFSESIPERWYSARASQRNVVVLEFRSPCLPRSPPSVHDSQTFHASPIISTSSSPRSPSGTTDTSIRQFCCLFVGNGVSHELLSRGELQLVPNRQCAATPDVWRNHMVRGRDVGADCLCGTAEFNFTLHCGQAPKTATPTGTQRVRPFQPKFDNATATLSSAPPALCTQCELKRPGESAPGAGMYRTMASPKHVKRVPQAVSVSHPAGLWYVMRAGNAASGARESKEALHAISIVCSTSNNAGRREGG